MKYITGINALRFLAAMLVLIYHCNDGLRQLSPTLSSSAPILQKGALAVDCFFIISGFLIMLLSLHERSSSGRFNVKKFYLRRALRILPLYYLGAALGLILVLYLFPLIYETPFADFSFVEVLPLYIFMMPNVVVALWENIGPMYSLWSIGVEEQFYLVFPLLLAFIVRFNIKKGIAILSLAILGYVGFYISVATDFISFSGWVEKLIVQSLRLHYILLGNLLGYLYYTSTFHHLWELIKSPIIQNLIALALVTTVCFLPYAYDRYFLLQSGLFALFLMSIVGGRKLGLDHPWLEYLGSISYGIYVFHPFVSVGLRYFIKTNETLNSILFKAPYLFYFSVALISIAIAAISFKYFESYFLRYKNKYNVASAKI